MHPRPNGKKTHPKGILAGFGSLLIFGAALILPTLNPGFSWTIFIVPFTVLLVLIERDNDWRGLAAVIITATCLAAIKGNLATAVFGFVMVPAGVMMKVGLDKGRSPALTAAGMFLATAIALFFFGTMVATSGGVNPYTLLLNNINNTVNASLDLLKENKELTPIQLQEIKATAATIKKVLPSALPGIIFSAIAGCALLNLVIGQLAVRRRRADLVVWPPFSQWKAPEPLIFVLIIAGFGLLIPLPAAQPVTIGLLLTLNVIYFYQGMAILTRLLEYWRTPTGLKVLIYAIMVIQAYGVLFLSLTGIIDVWANFRAKIDRLEQNRKENEIKEDPEE